MSNLLEPNENPTQKSNDPLLMKPEEEPNLETLSHLQVQGFRGKFAGVLFNAEGISVIPVPVKVRDLIKHDFPRATIRECAPPV